MSASQSTSKSAGAIGALLLAAALAPAQELLTRVSVNPHWHPTNGENVSYPTKGSLPSMSADGRWLVFDSLASNMTVGESYTYSDVFAQEVATGRIVNLTDFYYSIWSGQASNGDSYAPSISASGRFVVFTSDATNLDPNTTDSNGCADVYFCDRDSDGNGVFDDYPAFVRVSVDQSGGQANSRCWLPTISADGMRVLFLSDADNLVNDDYNGATDAFLRDLVNGTTERVDLPDWTTGYAEADLGCRSCDLSADGWTVAFDSWSDNLVQGDTNYRFDVFVRNLASGETSRVSVGTYQQEGDGDSVIRQHCLSSDGMAVAFSSFASTLDPTDANPGWDVFLHDRWSGVTTLQSVDSNGASANGDCRSASISADGLLVVFESMADNLVGGDWYGLSDVFVRAPSYGTTTLVSASVYGGTAYGTSQLATISPDGAYVVFASDAADLDPQADAAGLRDVFRAHLASGTVRYVTGLPAGEANGNSTWVDYPAVSDDGRFVAFSSWATNLVDDDLNGTLDVFVADRSTGEIVRVSVSSSGDEANGGSYSPSISADGRFVAFASWSWNLVGLDTNGQTDVFRHDRDPDGNGIFDEGNGVTTRVSVASNGMEGNGRCYATAISGDGNRIAFNSDSTNLDPRDTSYITDIFVRDVAAAVTELVTVSHDGLTGGDNSSFPPSISANGQSVAFTSYATNFLGTAPPSPGANWVYVRDLATDLTQEVSWSSPTVSGAWSSVHAISGDGNRIVFTGIANDGGNWVPASWVFDRAASTTTLLSVDEFGGYGDAWEGMDANISADGRHAVFASNAPDLVANDTNGFADVFLRDIDEGRTTLVSHDDTGAPANDRSYLCTVSGNGDVVAFASDSTNLVREDGNRFRDVFLYDRSAVARWSNYGIGFPGTLGIPSLTLDADPVLGTTVTLSVGNSRGAATAGLLFLSARPASTDLGYGAWILVDLPSSLRIVLPLGAGGLALPGDIPDDPTLLGLSIYLQCLELDPGAFKKLSFTRGLELHFGR